MSSRDLPWPTVTAQVELREERARQEADEATARAEAQLGLQDELGRLQLHAVERELAEARAAYEGLQRESAQRLGAVERCLDATTLELEAQQRAAAAAQMVTKDVKRELAEMEVLHQPPADDGQVRPLHPLR